MRHTSDESEAALRAQIALLLAEGKVEESLSPGNKLVQLAQSGSGTVSRVVDAHELAAQAYLAATCAKACASRHFEQLHAHAPEGAVFEHDLRRDADGARAAGMWRVMEAGRVFEQAAKADPEHTRARHAKAATSKLRNLDAFRVSSEKELFEFANCAMYEGVKLNGKRCPSVDANPYAKKSKGKKKKKGKA